MSPARFESRTAVTVIIVLSLAAPAAIAPLRPATAQALQKLESEPLRGLRSLPVPGMGSQTGAVEGGPSSPRGVAQTAPGAANYGAPRPKSRLPKPYPPPPRVKPPPLSAQNPLPALQPYKTSAQAKERTRRDRMLGARGLRGRIEDQTRPPPPTVAVQPGIPVKPKPRLEANPYDPIGIGIGSLRLFAFAEPSYGYDTNPNRLSSGAYGSKFFRIDTGLRLRSEWMRDDLQADLRLGHVDYFSVENADRPDGVGSFLYRYDVARDTVARVEGRFNLVTQRPGTPGLASTSPNAVVTNRPYILALGTSVGLTQNFNRLETTLRGSFDRSIYQNAYYSDGSTLDLASTSYNAYGLTPRVAYELNPRMKPFVEATIDKRVHDAYLDPYGYARDSHGFTVRGGSTFKFTDLLAGEASGGYSQRDYDDRRLPLLRGPIVDAALIYTATPLTTVTLRAATMLNETSLANAAGTLSRRYTAEVSHALLRNLTLTATGTYQTNNYQGAAIMERVASAGVKLEYNITRSIAIKGSYLFEHLNSSSRGADYTANVFTVGLRFQP